jgi:HEPN domain-containing protein
MKHGSLDDADSAHSEDSDRPEPEVMVQLVRLIVLCEDLKLEVAGLHVDKEFDEVSQPYREMYFARRTFATLWEMDSAFQKLNMLKEFKARKRSLDRRRSGFITQTFRNSADNDYIAARLLHRNGLDQPFLWSAQQAVAKYLKAILLYNGINSADLGHNLVGGFDRLSEIADIQFDLPDDTRDLLEYLQVYGTNRYLQHPSFTAGEELLRLDKAVWHIRRYCDYLRGELKNPKGERVALLPTALKRIHSRRTLEQPHRFRMHGLLERVLDDQKSTLRSHWSEPVLRQAASEDAGFDCFSEYVRQSALP